MSPRFPRLSLRLYSNRNLFLIIVLACCAGFYLKAWHTPAHAADTFTLVGSSSVTHNGFIVGPLTGQLNGASISVVDNDFDDFVNFGQTWEVQVRSFSDLSGPTLPQYQQVAWLSTQFAVTDQSQWGDLQFALWRVFDDDPTLVNAGSDFWLAMAQSQNFSNFDFSTFRILTPTGADGAEMIATLPTTYTVNSTADPGTGVCDSSECTLREAIAAANSHTGSEIINFDIPTTDAGYDSATGTYTITLGTALPDLTSDLSIIGLGADALTVRRDTSNPSFFRIFTIPSGKTVNISGLTITGGRADQGGGIFNQGTLTLHACAVTGNSATIGAGIQNLGFNSTATLTINNSTISGNTGISVLPNGGGIRNESAAGDSATLNINNSTIANNSAIGLNGGFVGGVQNLSSGPGSVSSVNISNSTISGNHAANGGGIGIYDAAGGTATLTLTSSIVSDNSANTGPDISEHSSVGTVQGSYNLVETTTDYSFASGSNNLHGDPLLEKDGSGKPLLADNGGPTKTIALLCGSPALDAGSNPNSLSTDQRGAGFARTFDDPGTANAAGGDATDIGAFELQQPLDCNDPPIADAGADQTIECGTQVTLNGTASSDPDSGDTLTYSWSENNTEIATGAQPTITLSRGTHTITLTVSDGSLSDTDEVTITIEDTTDPTVTAPSDITAYTSQNGATPDTYDGTQGCGATVSNLGTATATDACDGVLTPSPTAVPANNFFPVGTTQLTWSAIDASNNTGTDTQQVTVFDNTRPSITNAAASPSTLGPPNHKMRDVAISYNAADNCPLPSNACSITSITSNEPVNGTGDGDTAPDWEIVSANRVRLRAERAAKGKGRIYTVTISCTDGAGNTSTKQVTVVVPK